MKKADAMKSVLEIPSSPTDCPFREFRDSELSVDSWGLGPLDYKSTLRLTKGVSRSHTDYVWVDPQIQPLPRSALKRLHGWVRAEDLAQTLWETEVTIFDDNNGGSMSISDIQFAYYQLLQMSSFCRKVLSYCYILERAEDFTVEHQWENFIFNLPPEGWRARYHIYSPGLKYGGGPQHRPTLSKNGCYLVRLYYIGAWRCVWVSDQIPVDATECPLLPFAPYFSQNSKAAQTKPSVPFMSNPTVVLWPLLLCKALLKLAAPSMEDIDSPFSEDQELGEFDILHALTGALNLTYSYDEADLLWKLITSEVPLFSWDDDDDTQGSTIRPKAKKSNVKEAAVFRHRSITSLFIKDTREFPPYFLPGITPAFEMSLLVTMARDLPIKKPLPEPEVALWKHYRWVDWARGHGLYEAYDCPRTKFVKLNALLKLSQAPHLLDVQSTDSITFGFREEQGRTNPGVPAKKTGKEGRSVTNQTMSPQLKEELREWVKFDTIMKVLKNISILCYPTMFQFSSIASNPLLRITKAPPNKQIDIPASKTTPLYLQIDGPEENTLKISCGMLHPRVFLHAGLPIDGYIEPGYVLIEKFNWFEDCELPKPKVFLQTRGYDSTEVSFIKGRHFCRLWIHSRVPWHVMTLSESTICVGTRDVIQAAAVRECPWGARFLSALGLAFQNFVRISKSSTVLNFPDKDFYKSYQPDMDWNAEEVGYDKSFVHWMFRQALQATLKKKLAPFEYRLVCTFLQRYLKDPDFGITKNTASYVSTVNWLFNDPCDCMPEAEELELYRYQYTELTPEEVDMESFRHTICETVEQNVSCIRLRNIREMKIRRHEAAKTIQAFWRGYRTRKIVNARETITPEIMKYIMDGAFGNLEALSGLMNTFFFMFPSTIKAYSVASALTGTVGLKQHTGSTRVSPRCVWIPYFQVVFYCHGPVKVHLDLQCLAGTIKINSIIEVYNNDTATLLPQVYNTHFTYNFIPNNSGYTIIGHGSLKQPLNMYAEAHWQLNVMSHIANLFHVCDNDVDSCKEQSAPSATKVHIDEIYLPNQRYILGGLQISTVKQETICFRVSSTSPDLEMVAVLKSRNRYGVVEEEARYTGRGELYWPYIRLDGEQKISHKSVINTSSSAGDSSVRATRSGKTNKPTSGTVKNKSSLKLRDLSVTRETKTYMIEVRAPKGWPLTIPQWRRVIEIQGQSGYKDSTRKTIRLTEKQSFQSSLKDKMDSPRVNDPLPDDAYIEMECSLSIESGATARRDDSRDLEFIAAARSWDAKDPGRNGRGARIRKEFREEYLDLPTPPVTEIVEGKSTEMTDFALTEQSQDAPSSRQLPTPASSSPAVRIEIKKDEQKSSNKTMEVQDGTTYLTMPDELKDKFKPLDFIPSCTREQTEDECIVITSEMAEASRIARDAQMEAAIERMNQLQAYYEENIMEVQRTRCEILEKLFVDSQWSQGLTEALEARDLALNTTETNKNASLTRRKHESKTK